MEGRSVTLKTGINELQTDHVILWRFNDESKILAKINRETNETSIPGNVDERFRDTLKLNDTTGDLIITHSKTSDTGEYKMEIRDTTDTIHRRFRVHVYVCLVEDIEYQRPIEGRSVTLKTGLNELQTDHEILWMFDDASKILAKINRETNEMSIPGNADERFRDRLKLNDTTGDLIITHSKTSDSGNYKMKIRDSTDTIHRRFRVYVYEINVPEEFLVVTEGRSVTLKTGLNELQTDHEILWMFNYESTILAKINRETNETSIPGNADERFRDRLKLNDKTGDLIITHSKTSDSGEYKMKIRDSTETRQRRFRVSVKEIDVQGKFLVVKVGRSVTLQTCLNELQTDLEILWKFNDESTILAKINRETNETSIPGNADERFRDRLKLNDTTGDLIITHSKTSDAGEYHMKIIDSTDTRYETFRVLLYVEAMKILKRLEGRPVTLKTGLNELQTDQEILWMFDDESTILAKINRETNETSIPGNADERFRDRLKLNDTTGDLIITHSKTSDSGEYKMKIRDTTETRHKRFRVHVYEIFVPEEFLVVTKGRSVTLQTGLNELQRDHEILWKFNYESKILAKINRERNETSIPGNADERFKDRLKLNDTTGDLIITHIKTSDDGEYHLKITDSTDTEYKILSVIFREINVPEEFLVLMEGRSVTLKTGLNELQTDHEILWMFNNESKIFAKINRETNETSIPGNADERFRDRLKLNDTTGDLIITHSKTSDSGEYKMKIRDTTDTRHKRFRVHVYEIDVPEEFLVVTEGGSVTLKTGLNELQTDQEILWMFDDASKILAKINRETNETSIPGNAYWRFRDRLKLNDKTGDLIITNRKTSDSGNYKMKIKDSTETRHKRFRVHVYEINVPEEYLRVTEGRPVTLKTGLNELQTDQEILWKFYDESRILAKINRETNETSIPGNAYERFRDRLKLNDKTGDLTITNIKLPVAGGYEMEIKDSTETIHKKFHVLVTKETLYAGRVMKH
ncbi:hypothetical protein E1301_Tti022042 [Triplophysa tibetana]|uniref:Immunoglobulin domain-containing protein n=1 Tax=Triplophysa tibetana TaxID=1572043 RepID=A0A5A9NS56_9TELE|nr:hypothetical protein E1301_Tti022042 [Triplophysa tibetana]